MMSAWALAVCLAVSARAPAFGGTATCMGMEWEPTLAVDPHTPTIIAVASIRPFQVDPGLQISFDGGSSFTQAITPPALPGHLATGDPVLAFDSQGRLFYSYLCQNVDNFAPAVCLTGYDIDDNSGQFVPIDGIDWPVNVNAAANHGLPELADKEWLAADSFPGSPFADRLYMIWQDVDQFQVPLIEVWTTYSDDHGATWSDAIQVDAPDEGPLRGFPHVAVAPNGDVYLAYHSQTGFLEPFPEPVPDGVSGKVVLRRSQDGGATWGARTFPFEAGEADLTLNRQVADNGVVPGAQFDLAGGLQPWILPDPLVEGRVYVVASDDPDNDVNSGDAADVFIAISEDHGQSWSDPSRVDHGPAGTLQALPTAAVDPLTGTLVVTYYDNRALHTNPGGNYELDLLAAFSVDGGLTWLPEVDVNDGFFDPDGTIDCISCCDGSCPKTTRIGEYNGVAFGNSTASIAWADNTCSPGGDLTMLDTFFDQTNVAPIPAVSEWGVIAMTLLVLCAGTLVLRCRKTRHVCSRP